MARIKNTMAKNIYGDGYEQEITLDNGEQYIIRNSMAKNIYGDGYEKEIVKKDSSSFNSGEFIGELIVGLGALILMGILWLMIN